MKQNFLRMRSTLAQPGRRKFRTNLRWPEADLQPLAHLCVDGGDSGSAEGISDSTAASLKRDNTSYLRTPERQSKVKFQA